VIGLRMALRPIYDSAMGDRLRAWTGFRAPINVRPFTPSATVSDLFPWRADPDWETCFELMNMPSLLYPDDAPTDRATIVLYTNDGREHSRHIFELAPFERRRIEISSLRDDVIGMGTFACFHAAPELSGLSAHGSHLSERGYVGFRRPGDRLWSYVHGNQHVLSATPAGDVSPVATKSYREWSFRPQLRLDDADAFDLVISNPVSRPVTLSVRFFGAHGCEIERIIADVPPRGMTLLSRDRADGDDRIQSVETSGRCIMWRPLVFKYYASHFDALHG
jgi:hypothetical protein